MTLHKRFRLQLVIKIIYRCRGCEFDVHYKYYVLLPASEGRRQRLCNNIPGKHESIGNNGHGKNLPKKNMFMEKIGFFFVFGHIFSCRICVFDRIFFLSFFPPPLLPTNSINHRPSIEYVCWLEISFLRLNKVDRPESDLTVHNR